MTLRLAAAPLILPYQRLQVDRHLTERSNAQRLAHKRRYALASAYCGLYFRRVLTAPVATANLMPSTPLSTAVRGQIGAIQQMSKQRLFPQRNSDLLRLPRARQRSHSPAAL